MIDGKWPLLKFLYKVFFEIQHVYRGKYPIAIMISVISSDIFSGSADKYFFGSY